ncbi:hypothetical protein BHM03_00040628 [Ensete ventricosum]|nr:hypothetical protein BHM03_00040628 [Ensete ventricosum]
MEVVGSSPEGVSSGSPEVEEVSSSSGGMSPGDMKAFRALEIIRSCHSSDLVMIEELLRLVRWRYSIASDYENLKGIPRVPTTNVTRAIEASIQATMSSVREEPTKVPKACLHEGEDACPRKKPKQAVRKVSKSFAA